MTRQDIKETIENHPVIGAIHNQLVSHSIDLKEALNKASIMIYELDAELKEAKAKISAGYNRINTSHLSWKSKKPITPADDGEWIKTGKE